MRDKKWLLKKDKSGRMMWRDDTKTRWGCSVDSILKILVVVAMAANMMLLFIVGCAYLATTVVW